MRSEQIKAERRRRPGGAGRASKLAVNEAALDREKYEYRFANDTDNRLYQLTVNDDWEVVPDRDNAVVAAGNDVGAKASVVVGERKDGSALRGVLLRKLKAYYDDDQREKSRAIDDKEAGMLTGAVSGARAGETYIPSSGIKLTRG